MPPPSSKFSELGLRGVDLSQAYHHLLAHTHTTLRQQNKKETKQGTTKKTNPPPTLPSNARMREIKSNKPALLEKNKRNKDREKKILRRLDELDRDPETLRVLLS